MANFTFLRDKDEYMSFSESCIKAEEVWKNSPSSCISGCRTALESIVKWIYQKERNLNYIKPDVKDNIQASELYYRINNEGFKRLVPSNILKNLNYVRKLANKVLHENFQVTPDDGMRCLQYIFEFVQWVDRRYGHQYETRKFVKDEVPHNTSFWMQGLKYAGAAIGGAAALALAIVMADNDNNKKG